MSTTLNAIANSYNTLPVNEFNLELEDLLEKAGCLTDELPKNLTNTPLGDVANAYNDLSFSDFNIVLENILEEEGFLV